MVIWMLSDYRIKEIFHTNISHITIYIDIDIDTNINIHRYIHFVIFISILILSKRMRNL